MLGILSFWIARALFAAGGSSRKFCRALAVFGAAAALAAMVQKAVAPTLVLGILQPDARSANPLGAFTNRNHFAAWLLMIATVACGYLIAHLRIHPAYQQRGRAFLKQFLSSGALPTATAALITVGVLFLTLSRSAVAGLGAAGIAGWRIGRPRMQIERTSLPTLFGVGRRRHSDVRHVHRRRWLGGAVRAEPDARARPGSAARASGARRFRSSPTSRWPAPAPAPIPTR